MMLRGPRLLTDFAFGSEGADLVFACDVAGDNPASPGAFRRAGYHPCSVRSGPPGGKARELHDLCIERPG